MKGEIKVFTGESDVMRDLPKSTTHVVKKASDIFVGGKAQVPPAKPATNPRVSRLSEGIKASPVRQFMVSELSSSSEEDGGRGFSVDDILSDVQTGGSSSSSTSEVEPEEEEEEEEEDEDDTSGAGQIGGELSIGEESSSPRVVKRNGGKMSTSSTTTVTSSVKPDGANGVTTRLDQLRDGKTQGGLLRRSAI